MKKSRVLGILAGIFLIYSANNCLWRGIKQYGWFSEKMKNEADATNMVQRISRDLEYKNPSITIDCFFEQDDFCSAFAAKLGKKHYTIMFDEGKNMLVARHETYHVYDGHCDRLLKDETYFNKKKNEFQAWVYAFTGLKL